MLSHLQKTIAHVPGSCLFWMLVQAQSNPPGLLLCRDSVRLVLSALLCPARQQANQHVTIWAATGRRMELQQQLSCPVGMSCILTNTGHLFAAGTCAVIQHLAQSAVCGNDCCSLLPVLCLAESIA